MITDLEIPIGNPFLFRPILINGSSVEIDYDNYFPVAGMMDINEQYQAGVFPTDPKYYPDWLIDEQIAIQFSGDIISSAAIIVGPGIGTVMTNSTITPLGYTTVVKKFTYTPSVAGYYYIRFIVSTTSNRYEFRSHVFKVNDTFSDDKNLIEIQYYSDENINGFVFDGYYKAFYTGQFKIAPQQRSSSIIDEDISYLLASKSYSKKTVVLTDIYHIYYDQVAKQLENTTVKLNGMEYICKEPPELEYKEKSDLVDITFELTAKYDNNIINIP